MGQTGRSIKERYLEHIRYIKYNKLQLSLALDILQNLHRFGPVHNTLIFLQHVNKGSHMKNLKQFYIQLYSYNNKPISENTPEMIIHYSKLPVTFKYKVFQI